MSTGQNMKTFLDIQRDGDVMLITMNRPSTLNAISDLDAVQELVKVCEAMNRDVSVRAAVLTGTGKAFSVGGNLKTLGEAMGAGLGSPADSQHAYRDGIQRVPLAFHALDVPIIAAINGYALGAGNDLACMCDIRIASEAAVFAQTFVTLGLCPGDGGAWALPRAMNRSRAMEMAYTGRMFSAQEALQWDLVSRVVPGEQLLETSMGLAREIASNPSQALRLTKRLIREGEHASLASVLETSAAFQAILHQTQEHKDALRRHAERRGKNQ